LNPQTTKYNGEGLISRQNFGVLRKFNH